MRWSRSSKRAHGYGGRDDAVESTQALPLSLLWAILPAWLPVPQEPDGAMLLGHLSRQHPGEVGRFLEQMRTEVIGTVAAQAFDVIEEGETR